MEHHLFVVEGSHDAAFLRKLIKKRGFSEVRFLKDLVDPWRKLVPRRYPIADDGRLENIVVFPNVYRSSDGLVWIGVAIAGGGDDRVISALRTPIEISSIDKFSSIGVIIDADWRIPCAERFANFASRLENWNREEVAERTAGFPVALPAKANEVAGTSPRIGVYLFPDCTRQGTLETLLLDCAKTSMSIIASHAGCFLDAVREAADVDDTSKDAISTSSGMQKAHCGIIANVMTPGASIAAALRGDIWLNDDALNLEAVQKIMALSV